MKYNPFSPKTVRVLWYLKCKLPSTVYWCDDMMKMLLFIVDKEAELALGRQISNLNWHYNPDIRLLEAEGLSNFEHWEDVVGDVSLVDKVSAIFCNIGAGLKLSEEERRIVDQVVSLKNQVRNAVGSMGIRKEAFSYPKNSTVIPLRVGDDMVYISDNAFKEGKSKEVLSLVSCVNVSLAQID